MLRHRILCLIMLTEGKVTCPCRITYIYIYIYIRTVVGPIIKFTASLKLKQIRRSKVHKSIGKLLINHSPSDTKVRV